jgi:single-stranded DNA-binding protein
MNTISLFGRIEDQPKLMGVPGRDVCEFWVLVPTRKERHALHVKVVTFMGLAVRCADRLHQGDEVGVTGHLRSDELPQDSRGRKLFVHSVIGRQVDFVEGPDRDESS